MEDKEKRRFRAPWFWLSLAPLPQEDTLASGGAWALLSA